MQSADFNHSALADETPAADRALRQPVIAEYKLIRRVGTGGYGGVWLATSVLGELRAIKIVYRSSFDHERPYLREFEGIEKFEPISRSYSGFVPILHVGRNE